MTDARICALWAARVGVIMRDLGVIRHVPTLGAAAVTLIKQEIVRLGLDLNEFLGRNKSRRGKPRPKPTLSKPGPLPRNAFTAAPIPSSAMGSRPKIANSSTSI